MSSVRSSESRNTQVGLTNITEPGQYSQVQLTVLMLENLVDILFCGTLPVTAV